MFQTAFARTGYDYYSDESTSLSDIYCVSKQVRTRSTSGRLEFLTSISQYIPLGMAAKGEGEIEIAEGITVEHLARQDFEEFRRFLGVDEEAYLKYFSEVTGGAVSDGGRSGSLYWYSVEHRYLLKSHSNSEFDKLVDMMPRYVAHFQAAEQAGRPCLLLRFFGAYRFRAGDQVLGLLCMNDVWDGQNPSRMYDIKGTTHHRYVDEEDEAGVVLKDLNLHSYLLLNQEYGARLWAALQEDTEFLQKENAIDYSLLLGIDDAHCKVRSLQRLPCYEGLEVQEPVQEADPVFCANSKKEEEQVEDVSSDPRRFRMGIIDFLGQWNNRKKLEGAYKTLTVGCFHEHSSQPPDYYRERFVEFLEDKIVVDEGQPQ